MLYGMLVQARPLKLRTTSLAIRNHPDMGRKIPVTRLKVLGLHTTFCPTKLRRAKSLVRCADCARSLVAPLTLPVIVLPAPTSGQLIAIVYARTVH